MVNFHAVTVKIDGIDRSEFVQKKSLYIKQTTRNRDDICSFRLRDFSVDLSSQVEISVDGNAIFGGIITGRKATIQGVGNNRVVFWEVQAKSWVEQLEKSTLVETYTVQSDSAILADLFSTYTSGFDASTNVSTLDNDLDITFENISLRQALDQLSERVGADWYIDASKNLYWFNPSSPNSAAFSIDVENPNNSTTFSPLANSIEYSIDTSNIINKVIINGGTNATSAKTTDVFSGDGSKHTFGPTTDLIDTVVYLQYTDTDDNGYTTYGSFVGYAPNDKLVSEGGSYTAIIEADRRSITVEGNSGQAPKAATNITCVYYTKEPINITVEDTTSQGTFGVYPVSIYDQTFASETDAEKVAQNILAENAYGKTSFKFDITKFGLLPGNLLTVAVSTLGIGSTATNLMLLENGDNLLLENGDNFLLESTGSTEVFLIQEVEYIPILINPNEWMLVASVVCGNKQNDIIDSLAKVSSLKSNSGLIANTPTLTRLSNISSDLGEVVLGRATFTDGGTAKFNWGTPHNATGAVIGLEDSGGTAYGAAYIYESGNVKAKLGRLNDVPAIGTITPSGWGLYTNNGYFSGTVAASVVTAGTISGNTITGNTITGELITGGTVTGALVSGGTVTGSKVIGGTIATSTPPINSSNPGVIMDSTGLYGYGSAGLTFRLSSDPAIKPWFSSGTILDTVYEVNTSSVIRTGTTNPRIQIDNSGIFAYDSGGTLRFQVDVASGALSASNGSFQGTVVGSMLSANFMVGGTISGVLVSGNNITGGTITGGIITGSTLSGNTISGQLITGGTVSGGVVSGGTVTGAVISGNIITGNTITGGTVTGTYVTGGTIHSGRFTGTAIFDYLSSPTGNIASVNSSTANINNSVIVAAPNGVIYVNKISGPTAVQPMSSQGTLTLHDRWYINNSGWIWPSGSVAVGNRVIGLSTAGIDGIWFRDITNGSAYQLRVSSGVISLFGPI